MRVLAACSTCTRVYDAAGLPPGGRFRCGCGDMVQIPDHGEIHRHALHCAACGAARRDRETACTYCQTSFGDGALSRDTICPTCFARIRDDARFCDHCGRTIDSVRLATTASTLGCPTCTGATLRLRDLGQPPVPTAECASCGGLWLESSAFDRVVDQARETANAATEKARTSRTSLAPQDGPLYRPCPACGAFMNRRNFEKTSGVIIDVCRDHGLWFDADELAIIVRWIRQGGLEQARALAREQDTARARRRVELVSLSQAPIGPEYDPPESFLGAALEALTRMFLR